MERSKTQRSWFSSHRKVEVVLRLLHGEALDRVPRELRLTVPGSPRGGPVPHQRHREPEESNRR